MKYFLPVLIILACCIFSCKSFDNGLLLNKETFHKDVKPMRVIVNYESLLACFPDFPRWTPRDEEGKAVYNRQVKEYYNEIEQNMMVIKNNLTFETEPHNYYLSILVRKIVRSNNILWTFTNIFSISTLGLLGWPWLSETYTIHLESAILNSDGKVLKTYNATGTDTEYAALYWGYIIGDDGKTARIKALANACKDLRAQLKNDITTINSLAK